MAATSDTMGSTMGSGSTMLALARPSSAASAPPTEPRMATTSTKVQKPCSRPLPRGRTSSLIEGGGTARAATASLLLRAKRGLATAACRAGSLASGRACTTPERCASIACIFAECSAVSLYMLGRSGIALPLARAPRRPSGRLRSSRADGAELDCARPRQQLCASACACLCLPACACPVPGCATQWRSGGAHQPASQAHAVQSSCTELHCERPHAAVAAFTLCEQFGTHILCKLQHLLHSRPVSCFDLARVASAYLFVVLFSWCKYAPGSTHVAMGVRRGPP